MKNRLAVDFTSQLGDYAYLMVSVDSKEDPCHSVCQYSVCFVKDGGLGPIVLNHCYNDPISITKRVQQ